MKVFDDWKAMNMQLLEYRITLHYSDTNRVVGVDNTVVVVENVKKIVKTYKKKNN